MKKIITLIVALTTMSLLIFFATSNFIFHRAIEDIINCFPHIAIGTSFALLIFSIASVISNLKRRLQKSTLNV